MAELLEHVERLAVDLLSLQSVHVEDDSPRALRSLRDEFARMVGWRGGTSPPRSRQTGREPLDSSGFLLRLARIRLLSVARLAKRTSTKVRAFAPGLLPPLRHYYTLIRPSAPHPVLSPSAFGFGVLPFPPFPVRPRHDWFPSSVQEPARRSCPLYAGHRLASSETRRQAHPKAQARPWFRCHPRCFRRVIGGYRFRSTPWCIPDRGSPAFSCNAQDPCS